MGAIHLYGKNVETFKRLLLWSLLANVAQTSCGASLVQGNERVLKWLWSIDQDGHHAHLTPEQRMHWEWIFAQIIRDGRSTKVAKMMIVHWPLTFLRWGQVCFRMHLYGHHTFVWKKCWEFQMTSPVKSLGQCCSNFMWSLLGAGERKIAKMVVVHWPRRLPSPYMVKTSKDLLLKIQISPGA